MMLLLHMTLLQLNLSAELSTWKEGSALLSVYIFRALNNIRVMCQCMRESVVVIGYH